MSSLSPDNPIVLFGNIGPDVARISQIYDPDKDQFIPSADTYVRDSKTYYKKSYANRVISFTAVTDTTTLDNPKEAGLYEENDSADASKGKYVPAVKSIVVCDEVYDDYPERTLLIVDSVDDEIANPENPTFKSTFVPINIGTNVEQSARAVDYGNDRFMLYFEKTDEGNISLTPDRKLMMYGKRLYAYRLTRSGEVISAPNKVLTGSTATSMIPFSGIGDIQTVTLTEANYLDYAGCYFTKLVGNSYRTMVVQAPDDDDSTHYFQTFDLTYVSGRKYYQLTTDSNGKRVPVALTENVDYKVGDTVGNRINASDVSCDYIYVANLTAKSFFGADGITGSIVTKSDGLVHYPEPCYLRSGYSLVSGETITMEVFEYGTTETSYDATTNYTQTVSARMVLSVTLTAKPGTIINASIATTKQISKFDVTAMEDSETISTDKDGAWQLGVGASPTNWMFEPTLTFTDGSKLVVPVDGKQSFMYGLENVNSTNAGEEFRLLFKYFITPVNGNDENTAKRFVTVTKVIRVAATADMTIRKVSVLPIWNNDQGRYQFKFLVYKTDYSEPEIVDYAQLKATSKDAAYASINFINTSYRNQYGLTQRTGSIKSFGENFGFYQHAQLNMDVTANGYTSTVYTQNVALRLQNWLTATIDTKWLIGSYGTVGEEYEYTKDETPYGNSSTDIRPYIEYKHLGSGDVFKIGPGPIPDSNGSDKRWFYTTNNFLKAFYWNALTEPQGDSSKTITPTHFRIRTFATAKYYDALSGTYAIKNVKYYSSSGNAQPVVVGVTQVDNLRVRVQEDLQYFTKSDDDTYVQVTDLTIGDDINDELRKTLYVLREEAIATDFIPCDSSSDSVEARMAEFKLANATWSADSQYNATNFGGFIPVVANNPDGQRFYNTPVMGVVIVEFVYLENGTYKYIYGVPVEVRHPYSFCTDSEYKAGKRYYTYNAGNNSFDEVNTAGLAGTAIPATGMQHYEDLYS